MRKEEECSLAQGVRDFLLQYPRKTIALDALQQQFGTFAYEVFHGVIQHLLQEGSLRGIVSSGTDFGGLPRRYRLIRARLCSSSDQIQSDAARYAISARLDLSFYHEQLLPVWQRDLPYIVQLSSARGTSSRMRNSCSHLKAGGFCGGCISLGRISA